MSLKFDQLLQHRKHNIGGFEGVVNLAITCELFSFGVSVHFKQTRR